MVSQASLGSIIERLAKHGYTAEKAAARRIQQADDLDDALKRVVEAASTDVITLTEADVDLALQESPSEQGAVSSHTRQPQVNVVADMTGVSTGSGSIEDFTTLFQDRYERLRSILTERVQARSAASLEEANRRHGVGLIGMVADIRSTSGGHWLLELEDMTGVVRCLVHKNSDLYETVDRIVCDEVIGVQGTLSDDGGMLFLDELNFPNVPISNSPTTADRPVSAALISDIHVGSSEFAEEAWYRFCDWLDSAEAERIEYLLIAGDLVEGVGVYPGQDEELDIIEIYDQYRQFATYMEAIPDDIAVIVIPGNHDAVRLAEPQPGFSAEFRSILSAENLHIISNPGWVDLEGVTVLMYHGTSLDELIAELPGDVANYDAPDGAMTELLKKRHLAPQYGKRTRISPEHRDHLVIDPVPDIFHAGHTHTLGVSQYREVRVVNSGCWQHQTPFQRKVDIDPDVGIATIIDLSTLDVTVRTFV